MSLREDRAAARAQRARAQRALAEAEAALDRLNGARARADELLRRRLGGESHPHSEETPSGEARREEDALDRRMRHIESRMKEADRRMRGETDPAAPDEDAPPSPPPRREEP